MEEPNKKQTFLSKLKFYTKTAVLAATTLVTGISCGSTEKQKIKLDKGSYVYEKEGNTENNIENNTIATTVQNMIKEKTETKNDKESKKVNEYIENYEKYEADNDKNETNIEDKTESKSDNKTESKIENKTEASKENKTDSLKPIIGGHKVQSPQVTTIKNKDIHITTTKKITTAKPTTKKIITTTTQRVTEPPVTQPPVTQPPKTDYNKHDLLNSDSAISSKAFEKLSNELREELYGDCMVRGTWGVTNGADQAKIILAMLNYNQGISSEALSEILGNISKDDVTEYGWELLNIPAIVNRYDGEVDFNKYIINDQFANSLNDATSKYRELENGNANPMCEMISSYAETCDFNNPDTINNPIEFCILACIGDEIDGFYEDEALYQYYIENVANPLCSSYEAGYARTR